MDFCEKYLGMPSLPVREQASVWYGLYRALCHQSYEQSIPEDDEWIGSSEPETREMISYQDLEPDLPTL